MNRNEHEIRIRLRELEEIYNNSTDKQYLYGVIEALNWVLGESGIRGFKD